MARKNVPAVTVEDVSVRFRPFVSKRRSAKRSAFSLPRRERAEVVALDQVGFEVMRGEAFGVIGPNGAGKSTLLKVMAGTLQPDGGKVTRYGRLSPLLTLGAGFNSALSGRENILLGGLANGITKKEIESRYDQIIDFSDLGAAIDRPVGTYSSGMFSRLAFSVAINLQPEILLLDEIMAVGDAVFRRKSMRAMRSLVDRSGTIILVSHSMTIVSDLCSRVLWLDGGKVRMLGPAAAVVQAYKDDQSRQENLRNESAAMRERAKRGRPRQEQRSDRGNILIVGSPSSGVTDLYAMIKNAVEMEGSDYYFLSEPTKRQQLESLLNYAPEERVVAKVMTARYESLGIDVTKFHRRLLVHRDPRDLVVAGLLGRLARADSPEAVARFDEALAAKRSDPATISVVSLSQLADDLELASSTSGRLLSDIGRLLEIEERGQMQEVGHDAMTTGPMDAVSEYVGLRLSWKEPEGRQAANPGDWRDWFTAEDVAFYQPDLDRFIERFGYTTDWTLNPAPVITGPRTAAPLDPVDELQRLRVRASDGHPAALVALAKMYLESESLDDRDVVAGRLYAYHAAIQGDRLAMHMLSRCFRDGSGVKPDPDRRLFWLKESARLELPAAKAELRRVNKMKRLQDDPPEIEVTDTDFDEDI